MRRGKLVEPIVRFREKWTLSTEHSTPSKALQHRTAHKNNDGYGTFGLKRAETRRRIA